MADILDCLKGLKGYRDASRYEDARMKEEIARLGVIARSTYANDRWKDASPAEIYDGLREKIAESVSCALTPAALAGFVRGFGLENFRASGSQFNLYGIFAGVLLDLLTEKERRAGRETVISIDGGGARFDMLFYGARNVGRLFLSNFNGDMICADIGGGTGRVELVSVAFCSGDGILSGAGGKSHDGGSGAAAARSEVRETAGGKEGPAEGAKLNGTVIAAVIKGNDTLARVSNFANIVGYRLEGRRALYRAGRGGGDYDGACAGTVNAADEGTAGTIAAFDITGPDALNLVGGSVEKVIASGVKGHNALRLPEGIIKTMVCENISGVGALAGVVRGAVSVETIAYKNTPALDGARVEGMVRGDDDYERYERIVESTKLRAIYKSLAAMYPRE